MTQQNSAPSWQGALDDALRAFILLQPIPSSEARVQRDALLHLAPMPDPVQAEQRDALLLQPIEDPELRALRDTLLAGVSAPAPPPRAATTKKRPRRTPSPPRPPSPPRLEEEEDEPSSPPSYAYAYEPLSHVGATRAADPVSARADDDALLRRFDAENAQRRAQLRREREAREAEAEREAKAKADRDEADRALQVAQQLAALEAKALHHRLTRAIDTEGETRKFLGYHHGGPKDKDGHYLNPKHKPLVNKNDLTTTRYKIETIQQIHGKEGSRLRRKGAPKPIKVVCHLFEPRPKAEQRALLPKPAEGALPDDLRYKDMPLPRLPLHELNRRFAFVRTEKWGLREFRQRTGYQEFPWPARAAGAQLNLYIQTPQVNVRVDPVTDCTSFRPDAAARFADHAAGLAAAANDRARTGPRAALALGVAVTKK